VVNEAFSITDLLIIVLSAAGVGFMLVSSIGILRLPDVFSRMHAAGKASTVGVSFVLLAAGLYFGEPALLLRMVALIALIFATAPVATTAMARAAYRTGAARRMHLKYDEMAGAQEPPRKTPQDTPQTALQEAPTLPTSSLPAGDAPSA
jgi:multicomponent Na+:H+ antiporter subunit G